jgi:hypothetical protein
MAKSVKQKMSGRPAGSPTRYPGIMQFCAIWGYSHQHVRLVLDGQRDSRRVNQRWSEFHVTQRAS